MTILSVYRQTLEVSENGETHSLKMAAMVLEQKHNSSMRMTGSNWHWHRGEHWQIFSSIHPVLADYPVLADHNPVLAELIIQF